MTDTSYLYQYFARKSAEDTMPDKQKGNVIEKLFSDKYKVEHKDNGDYDE